MGNEFGQWSEWRHDESLQWHLADYDRHAGIQRWVADLNRLYRERPELHERDTDPSGFEWIDGSDAFQSVISFLRRGKDPHREMLVVCNFTPVPREGYRVGVPSGGLWTELLNSDSGHYGGSGIGNAGAVHADPVPHHGRPFSVSLTLPPLGVVFLGRA
jgi:1,4-alpha-glucan branching enzyme